MKEVCFNCKTEPPNKDLYIWDSIIIFLCLACLKLYLSNPTRYVAVSGGANNLEVYHA